MNVNSGLPLLLPRQLSSQGDGASSFRSATVTSPATSSSGSDNTLDGKASARSQSDKKSTTLRETLSPSDTQKLRENIAEREKFRAQQLPFISKASLETQRALGAYQQTLQASQEFDGGVLVGIDTFA